MQLRGLRRAQRGPAAAPSPGSANRRRPTPREEKSDKTSISRRRTHSRRRRHRDRSPVQQGTRSSKERASLAGWDAMDVPRSLMVIEPRLSVPAIQRSEQLLPFGSSNCFCAHTCNLTLPSAARRLRRVRCKGWLGCIFCEWQHFSSSILSVSECAEIALAPDGNEVSLHKEVQLIQVIP